MILEHEVQDFVAQLRRRQVQGSLDTAKRTAEILRLLLATQRHPTAQALLDDVRVVGSRLQAAKPAGMSPPVIDILFAAGMSVCMHALFLNPVPYSLMSRMSTVFADARSHRPQSWRSETLCGV